jgi:hypothetical protein
VVIRQNAQRGVPTRPILFISVILAALALALSAGSVLKSNAPVSAPSKLSVTTLQAPDAQERNQQILQSRSAQPSKAKKVTVQ